MKANDVVRHIPTGEEWIVCGVCQTSKRLIACGYPFPTVAKIADCGIIESRNKPQTKEQKNALISEGMFAFIEED